jgi:hypothetical protein
MHSLRRSIVGKLGGFAALCAILLLSFAPMASQSLAHEGFIAPLCASGPQQAPKKHTLAHLDACGYCDLVTHAPTPPILPHTDRGYKTAREPFDAVFSFDAPRSTSRPHAQPRAPPAFT